MTIKKTFRQNNSFSKYVVLECKVCQRMYLTQVQDERLRLYFRIWEWLRLRRTQTTYRRADGSGRRIEYWVGGEEREGSEIETEIPSVCGCGLVSNNFISKHFSARGAHPSALYVIFHSNQYSVCGPVLVF